MDAKYQASYDTYREHGLTEAQAAEQVAWEQEIDTNPVHLCIWRDGCRYPNRIRMIRAEAEAELAAIEASGDEDVYARIEPA